MPANAAARRYAEAVFDIAKEQNTLAEWDLDLRVMRETIEGNPALTRVLANPETSLSQTQRVVERSFQPSVSPLAYNLVKVLVQHRRLLLAPQIQEAFEELYLADQGIAYADVTTAVALTPVEEARVVESLTRLTGKTIKLRTHIDPDVLGGILARVGDQLIDGTVATQLRRLKNRLAAV